MQHAQEPARGLIPLAFYVPSLYLSHMATLGGRGHLLGTRSDETGGSGAVRPDGAFGMDVGIAPLVRQPRTADFAPSVTRWRFDAVRVASVIHAQAFGQSRRRSVASMCCSDRLVVGDGAVASMSTVPGRLGSAAYALVSVVAVLLPGLLNSLVSNSAASPAVRTVVVGAATVAALVVGVECVRKLMLGLRWRRLACPSIELTNVSSWPGGQGAAGRLIDDIVRTVAAEEVDLVVRVDRANTVALALYRSRGFVEINGNSTNSLIAMRRLSRSASTSASIASHSVPTFVAGASVAMLLGLAQASAAGVGAPAVVGLGVGLAVLVYAAVIDLRTLRIPNWCVVAGWVAAAIAGAAHGEIRGVWLGAAIGASPFLLIHLTDPRSLGFGDVKFAAASGALVGVVWWPAALLSCLVALAMALIVRIIHPRPRPFAPCLMVGTVAALIAASWAIDQGVIST